MANQSKTLIPFPLQNESLAITHFDRAKQELELAATIDEVKSIRDKAQALLQYAKQSRLSLEMQNHCAEIRIRAERRAGEMLNNMKKHPPGPAPKGDRYAESTEPPRLGDLGITKNQSSKWQVIASIPEQDFEKRVESIKKNGKEITTKEFQSLAGFIRREQSRNERRESAAKAASQILPDNMIDIRLGDFREVLLDVPNNSVALVCCDPPYRGTGFEALWEALSEFAARTLMPGKLLATYCGNYYLLTCMKLLETHLEYVWTCPVIYKSFPDKLFKHKITTWWKPVLLFSKGQYRPEEKVPWIHDLIQGDGMTKENHRWEQGIGEARHLIEGLTYEGDLVIDPFLGSGTVALACKSLGRRFIGCDVDEHCVNQTRQRLAEEVLPYDGVK